MRTLLLPVVVVAVAGCRGSGSDTNVVLRVQPEMAGARCPNGGLAVQSGFDLDGNGTLDDAEVQADNTRYVCNGANGTNGQNGMDGQPGAQGDAGTPGINALSQVTQELPGTNCQYGGSRVDVGPDTNGNGMLESGEITSTRYICDRASIDAIYFGDVRLRDADDLAQLDGIQVVIGDVTVENIPNGMLSLPELRIISGTLQVGTFFGGGRADAPVPLTSISLPELTQAGGVNITYSSALTTIALPKLARAKSVDVTFNSVLTTLTIPSLVRVDYVRIESNDVLASLALSAFTTSESFRIGYNPALATLTAPLLRQADDFEVQYNPALSSCAVYRLVVALSTQPSNLQVSGNDTTTQCTAADTCRVAMVPGITPAIWTCLVATTFDLARMGCSGISANAGLMWFESDAEWLAFKGAVQTGAVGHGWVGYSDAVTEGTWANFASSTYDPTARTDFWAFLEPNGGSAENGLEILSSGLANDLATTSVLPFICRVP